MSAVRALRHSPYGPSALAAVVFAALVATSLLLTHGIPAPGFASDEFGYLANARFIADSGAPPNADSAPFYSLGYSLILAIPYALGAAPLTAFHTGLIANGLMAGGMFLALIPIARRVCGLPRYASVVAAGLVALLPPVLLNTGIAWAESTLWLLSAVWALTGWLLVRRLSVAAMLLFVAVNASLYLTHGRAAALVLAGVTLIIALGALKQVAWRWVVTALAVLGALLLAIRAAEDHVRSSIYGESPFSEGSAGGAVVGTLTDPGSWDTVALRAAGQLWYLGVTTAGLAWIGWVILVLIAVRERADTARRLWAAMVALGAAGMLLVSSAFMASGAADRIDKLFYGRYVEVAAAVPFLLGVAWIMRPAVAARRLAVAAGVMAGIVVLGAVTVAGNGSDRFENGLFHPGTVLGVIFPSGTPTGGAGVDFDPVRTTAVGAGAVLVLCISAAISRPAAITFLALTLFVSTVAVQAQVIRPIMDGVASTYELHRSPVLGEAEAIAYDTAGGASGSWAYQFLLDDARFYFFDSRSDERPPVDLVIADINWTPPGGARPVAYSSRTPLTAWVMAGPISRSLAHDGQLPGRRLDTPLPPRAARSDLIPVSDATTLSVPTGGERVLTLTVRNTGSGAAWRQALYFPEGNAPGYVYLESGIAGRDGLRIQGPSSQLPRTVPSGDAVAVETVVAARTADGAPLKPGRYTAEFRLTQAGIANFGELSGEAPLRIPLVVTP